MIATIIWIIFFFIGYSIIFFAADVFLDNLKDICIIYGISPFIIGILIIGIDPEESIASIVAAINGLQYLAVGNVIGNSILAICISFGIPAFFRQIKFKSYPQFYFSLIYGCIFLIFIGILINFGFLIIGFLVIIIYFFYIIRSTKIISKRNIIKDDLVKDYKKQNKIRPNLDVKSKIKKLILIIFSFFLIIFGGEVLIYSTERILLKTNISETFFGLVIIAFVTNVEELTLVIKSIKKKSVELGFGGMVGKIIWNLTITFGVSAVIIINFSFVWIILWNLLLLFIIMLYFNWASRKELIEWKDGIIFSVLLIIFLILNFIS
ncbi:MAG: hypothetical protein ACFFCI_11800 [Promethearchaeota archaeon]